MAVANDNLVAIVRSVCDLRVAIELKKVFGTFVLSAADVASVQSRQDYHTRLVISRFFREFVDQPRPIDVVRELLVRFKDVVSAAFIWRPAFASLFDAVCPPALLEFLNGGGAALLSALSTPGADVRRSAASLTVVPKPFPVTLDVPLDRLQVMLDANSATAVLVTEGTLMAAYKYGFNCLALLRILGHVPSLGGAILELAVGDKQSACALDILRRGVAIADDTLTQLVAVASFPRALLDMNKKDEAFQLALIDKIVGLRVPLTQILQDTIAVRRAQLGAHVIAGVSGDVFTTWRAGAQGATYVNAAKTRVMKVFSHERERDRMDEIAVLAQLQKIGRRSAVVRHCVTRMFGSSVLFQGPGGVMRGIELEFGGTDWEQFPKQGISLRDCDAVFALAQLASALDVLHQNGIYHGDIKPGNVLMQYARRFILIDFGFGKPDPATDDAIAKAYEGAMGQSQPREWLVYQPWQLYLLHVLRCVDARTVVPKEYSAWIKGRMQRFEYKFSMLVKPHVLRAGVFDKCAAEFLDIHQGKSVAGLIRDIMAKRDQYTVCMVAVMILAGSTHSHMPLVVDLLIDKYLCSADLRPLGDLVCVLQAVQACDVHIAGVVDNEGIGSAAACLFPLSNGNTLKVLTKAAHEREQAFAAAIVRVHPSQIAVHTTVRLSAAARSKCAGVPRTNDALVGVELAPEHMQAIRRVSFAQDVGWVYVMFTDLLRKVVEINDNKVFNLAICPDTVLWAEGSLFLPQWACAVSGRAATPLVPSVWAPWQLQVVGLEQGKRHAQAVCAAVLGDTEGVAVDITEAVTQAARRPQDAWLEYTDRYGVALVAAFALARMSAHAAARDIVVTVLTSAEALPAGDLLPTHI